MDEEPTGLELRLLQRKPEGHTAPISALCHNGARGVLCSGAQDGEKVAAPALDVIKLVQQDPKFVRKQLNKEESSAAVALAAALAAIDRQNRRKQKKRAYAPPESARAKLATALGRLSAQATYSRGHTTPGDSNLHLQLCRGKFTSFFF